MSTIKDCKKLTPSQHPSPPSFISYDDPPNSPLYILADPASSKMPVTGLVTHNFGNQKPP